ncbi:unnamed protein product [Mytilus edulis]|uniref:B box-type domain-containing protein n=1 Tax=Mytilus edulis TaxID=6550 RepID=A0A8S3Q4F7_MYTED|nr:unnamed protein product [Mytilus edulis]
MATPVFCDPCCYHNKTVQANTWCVECEEGFCSDCEEIHKATKYSRGHHLITIDNYRNIQHINIEQTCRQHSKIFDWFCKSHDEPLCKACVSSEHKICPDVVPLENVTVNAKHSMYTNRYRHKDAISRKPLKTPERKSSAFFDELQQRLLQELSLKADECLSESSKDLQNFEDAQKYLTKLKKQTFKLIEFSSNLHMFLGTREVYKDVNKEIKSIILATSHSRSYNIEFDFHPMIDNLLEHIIKVAKINIEKQESGLLFNDAKMGQAQIQRSQVNERRIQDIVLQLDKN